MTQRSALIHGGVLAALASIGVGAQAQAQEIEEVTVTAQKREQSVNDVPIAISAYSGNLVEDLGVRSAEDLTKLTPGLEVSTSGGVGTKVWTIRGVGFSDYSTSASSTVGVYVDEVAIPYPVMSTVTFFDVERIEVVKGPQGDLYGRNTTAGQVNIVSRMPTRELAAGVKLGYARYETIDAEGFLSGPFSDRARGRLAFATTQSGEGWQESLSRPGDKLGEIDRMAVRGIVELDFTDTARAMFKGYYNQDKSDNVAPTAFDGTEVGLPFATLHGGPFNTAGELEQFVTYSTGDNTKADWTNGPDNALRPRRDNELKGASLRLTWDIDDLELVALSGYDKFDRTEANDWDGTALLDSSNINVTDIESFSQEVRLSGKNDRLTWVAGVYYSDDKMTEDYNYFFGEGRFGINQLNTNYEQKTDALAAFGHLEYRFTDRVEGILGLRYTSEDREWTGCTYDASPTDIPVAGLPLSVFLNNIINGPGVITPNGLLNDGFNTPNGLGPVVDLQPNGCGTFNDIVGTPNAGQYAVFSRKISADEPMWKVGLNFRPTEGILLFSSISHGFKSGGFNGANSNTHLQLVPYEIEAADGVRGRCEDPPRQRHDAAERLVLLLRLQGQAGARACRDAGGQHQRRLQHPEVGDLRRRARVAVARDRGVDDQCRGEPAAHRDHQVEPGGRSGQCLPRDGAARCLRPRAAECAEVLGQPAGRVRDSSGPLLAHTGGGCHLPWQDDRRHPAGELPRRLHAGRCTPVARRIGQRDLARAGLGAQCVRPRLLCQRPDRRKFHVRENEWHAPHLRRDVRVHLLRRERNHE